MRSKLLIPLFTLMLCMSTLFFTATIYASDASGTEPLTVDGVWLEGEMLQIEVTDKQTGINQTLEIALKDYAGNSEYISVQAVDKDGNKSNTVQFLNPFYEAAAEPNPASPTNTPEQSESAVPDDLKPFTPEGTGSVVDNVTDGDGKEFFTITTEDGNVFYMVIDRQRTSENVYLLNAVTADDLAALAKKSSVGGSASAIPTTPPEQLVTSEPPLPEPEPSAPPTANNTNTNSGAVIFIAIAALSLGGVGYYFKILRPKKNAAKSDDEDEYDDIEDDSDYFGEDEYAELFDEDGDEE